MKAIPVALCLLLLFLEPQEGSVLRVALIRVQTVREAKLLDGSWAEYWRQYQQSRSNGSQPLKDYYDTEYIAEVTLGNPPQRLRVLMDTGSASLWVNDKTCADAQPFCPAQCAHSSSNCHHHCDRRCCHHQAARNFDCSGARTFDSSISSSYAHNGAIFYQFYGLGFAKGFLGADDVCFGDTGLCVRNQTFGQATTAAIFRHPIADGICGLGFRSIAFERITPPFFNLLPQLDAPLFSVFLKSLGNVTAGQEGGRITYGAVDTQNCAANITWARLSSHSYWMFILQGVRVGGYSHSQHQQAICDTGSALIYGPKAIIQQIRRQINGFYDDELGMYLVDCKAKLKPVVFTINGVDYSIESKHYIILSSGGRCFLGFQEMFRGARFDWLLGMIFIRQYCTVFDVGNSRIGFAAALN